MGWRWIVFSVLGPAYVSGCVSGPGNQAVPGADAMPGLEETGPAAPAPSTGSVDCDANAGNLSCDAPNGAPFHFWQDCAIHPLTFEADSAVVREKIGNPEYQPEGLTPTTTSILVWAGTCRSMVLGHETVVLGADFWTAKANVLVNDTLASPDPTARHAYAFEVFFEDERIVSAFQANGFPASRGDIEVGRTPTGPSGRVSVNGTVLYEFQGTNNFGSAQADHFLHHWHQAAAGQAPVWAQVELEFEGQAASVPYAFTARSGVLASFVPVPNEPVLALATEAVNTTATFSFGVVGGADAP